MLDLLEKRPDGLFARLEDANLQHGRDQRKDWANKKFYEDVRERKEKKNKDLYVDMLLPKLSLNRRKENQNKFHLQHYAKTVVYDVTGFIEKNNDQISQNMKKLLASSSSDLIVRICQLEQVSA